jgi:hypothetical protein
VSPIIGNQIQLLVKATKRSGCFTPAAPGEISVHGINDKTEDMDTVVKRMNE